MPPCRLIPPIRPHKTWKPYPPPKHAQHSDPPAHSSRKSKPPRHHNYDLSAHEARIRTVLSHSLAKSTNANYDAATRAFRSFCAANDFTPLPANEFTLVAYVAFLASSMAGSSIANAISGIKSWHIATNNTWAGSPRLQMALKGAANLTPITSRAPPRSPVTQHMLEKLAETLNPGIPEDRAILAVALTAFWGQCRLGELLGSSSRNHNHKKFPSISSLGPPISNSGSRPLHLPCTKTNQLRGESIVITVQPGPADPIAALLRHTNSLPSLPPNSHLFAFRHTPSNSTKILTHERFISRINTIWSSFGFERITGHAFRIGGTTALLKAGVPPEIVKIMGRWSSDAYFRYWRDTNDITIQHAEAIAPTPSQLRPSSGSGTSSVASRNGSQRRHQGPHVRFAPAA